VQENEKRQSKAEESEPEDKKVSDFAEELKVKENPNTIPQNSTMNRIPFNFTPGRPLPPEKPFEVNRNPNILLSPIYTPGKLDQITRNSTQAISNVPNQNQNLQQQANSIEPPQVLEEISFSTEKIKKHVGYSQSVISPGIYAQQNIKENSIREIQLLAIKSGLIKLNCYNIISKFKHLQYSGIKKLKSEEFIEIIQGQFYYKFLPEHILNSTKFQLLKIYSILDTKNLNEVEILEIGKILIILCGGTLRDKLDSIGILYEKYGIQQIDSSEFANLCERFFKLYEKFDSKFFEKINTFPAEIASSTSNKLWSDLNIINSVPISPLNIKNWVKNQRDGELTENLQINIMNITKKDKENEYKENLVNTLNKLLQNKAFFNIIPVFLFKYKF